MAKPRPSPAKGETTGQRSELRFALIVLAVHAAITLWVGLHHEPWRDEADVWLLLRDGGVGTMLERTGYVGMPSLWYLMLAPFAVPALPYITMTLFHLVVAWAAVLVFLLYAPFSRWMRILFVFSYFMAYEYSVVARPYAVMLLCLFAMLAWWRKRAENPIPAAIFLALMANSTTHGLFMGAILGVIFLGETFFAKRLKDRRALAALGIMLVGGLLSFIQLLPPRDVASNHIVRGLQWEGLPWALGNGFFPGLGKDVWPPFFIALVVLALITIAIGRRIVPQIFMWGSLISLSVIYVFVWIAGFRHAGLMLISVVAALWLASMYEPVNPRLMKVAMFALGVSLFYCVAVAARYWQWDTVGAFTGAKEMAEFLERNNLDRYEIAAHKPPESESILPYLNGKRFYYAGMHQHGSYMTWDRDYNFASTTPYRSAVVSAQQELAGKTWLLLVNSPMENAEQYGFRLIYTNQRLPFEKRDERYWLYQPLDWSGPPLTELK